MLKSTRKYPTKGVFERYFMGKWPLHENFYMRKLYFTFKDLLLFLRQSMANQTCSFVETHCDSP